jgi:diacylglycerol O-acyltransferase / wax synthase
VNDVPLTMVAGGLRELLLGGGEPVDGVELRVIVPVSLHNTAGPEAKGNVLGQMIVALPVGEPDATRRLALIVAQTAGRRGATGPRHAPVLRSRRLQRAMLNLLARQRVYNTYVANVPGPPMPLYLAGARLLEVFPVVALMGNLTIGAGALSYAGQFTITVVADRDGCPDIDVFTRGARETLASLAVQHLPTRPSLPATSASWAEPFAGRR